MKIALIESFYGGSHQAWAQGYQKHSEHEVEIFSLPSRHWKWRMQAGPVHLAGLVNEKYQTEMPDLFLVTSLLDLARFRGLLKNELRGVPCYFYFHENQLAYPWSPRDPDLKNGRFRQYGFMQWISCLAADRVYFNSHYNKNSFFQKLPELLGSFPDFQNLELIKPEREKAQVLALGMELSSEAHEKDDRPLIVWSHRWEHDKNPEGFFRILEKLSLAGKDFSLAVLGQRHRQVPECFQLAQKNLSKHIVHWGGDDDRSVYESWLSRAHFLPVTSNQEFYGISVVEAMSKGVWPLLPDRLSYPELIPEEYHRTYLYQSESECVEKLASWLESFEHWERDDKIVESAQANDWFYRAKQYDREFIK